MCAASPALEPEEKGATMTSRRVLIFVATALAVACTSAAHVAHADPSTAPARGSTKKPVTAHAKARPASKPAPATKKPPKHTTTEAAEIAKPQTAAGAGAGHEVVEHESRIEFDERMVRGQTASGAIFLFQRSPSDLKSMVEVPGSFREKTVELVAPRGAP
jgi:hypothetical protein